MGGAYMSAGGSYVGEGSGEPYWPKKGPLTYCDGEGRLG